MTHTGALCLRDNPQYFINFCGQPAATGETIMCWVVISKLLVTHKDGCYEDEENSNDLMALHVFANSTKGTKVLDDINCVQRSGYSPDQTIT